MKRLASIAAITGLMLSPGLAQAQIVDLDSDDLADVQCFAVFGMIAGSIGAGAQAVEEMDAETATVMMGLSGGMMYHLGRLEGRTPDIDWLERISASARTIEPVDLEPARERCAKSLSDTGDALVTWGERLQKE